MGSKLANVPSVEQNRRQSRLLRLPGEVRNHIWGYVLGYQMIHVKSGYKIWPKRDTASSFTYSGYHYTVCESPITEMQAYELSRNERERNALQRALIKKLHLASDIVFKPLLSSLRSNYGMLEELYIDITTTTSYLFIFLQRTIQRTYLFRSKSIYVICSGTRVGVVEYAPIVKDSNGLMTVQQRLEKADAWRDIFVQWGQTSSQSNSKDLQKE
ncbi:hypothetical protein VTL71DRAFT_6973 [Oculimacula yallundae]|uniref:Uncharacterized protein n=1 Tax=Oculimacula yallundae TaxID=86028 RepID=A0ABR4BWI9_9HELO